MGGWQAGRIVGGCDHLAVELVVILKVQGIVGVFHCLPGQHAVVRLAHDALKSIQQSLYEWSSSSRPISA